MKEQFKKYIHQRIDTQLLNLKLAAMFFNCYNDSRNTEKGYLILSSAFEANKKSIDIYLDLFIKYRREKRLMTHFLNNKELEMPVLKKFNVKTLFQWATTFSNLSERNPYIDYLLKYYENYVSIDQMKDILETLAVTAVKTCRFH